MESDILQTLITAAKKNSLDGWEYIDNYLAISANANNRELIDWALQKGLSDENEYVRDLAVSILEKSTIGIDDATQATLTQLLETDVNPYVQFRSAFTLFNRGIRPQEVIKKIHEALEDPDVKEIAERYLQSL